MFNRERRSLPERVVQTFEWEGMPGHVIIDTVTFEEFELFAEERGGH